MDCDIVVKDDLSKLYNAELGDNLLAAVSEQSVQITEEFIAYVNNCLHLRKEEYFNSGVLVMNLKAMRKFHLLKKVIQLSKKAAFIVAPDQDMLNITCHNRVLYLDKRWNTVPMGEKNPDASLIHYIHIFKPWNRPDCLYAELFWATAGKIGLDKKFEKKLNHITDDMLKQEEESLENLKKFALEESKNAEKFRHIDDEIDENDPYYFIPLKDDEIYKRIDKLEKSKMFNEDVNDDPPTKPLLKGDVDYKKLKLKTKILSYFYNKNSYKFFKKKEKNKEIIIDKYIGVENLEALKTGAIITQNHFSPYDSIPIHFLIHDKKPNNKKWLFKVIREGNYNFPGIYGKFMKYCNPLPLSSNFSVMKEMRESLTYWLNKCYLVLIYPEQALWLNYRKPRPTKLGAFHMASANNCPILPTFITMRDSDVFNQYGECVQAYTYHIAPPIFPQKDLSIKENALLLQSENERIWKEIYESTYKIPLRYSTDDSLILTSN